MLVTDDDELARRARSLRDLGVQPSRRFRHEELGSNFRLSSLQAALALPQIDRLESLLERKAMDWLIQAAEIVDETAGEPLIVPAST